jgi:hypothetical protein
MEGSIGNRETYEDDGDLGSHDEVVLCSNLWETIRKIVGEFE